MDALAPVVCQNIIIQHMDITEPLTTLRDLLEKRLQCSLKHHEFWLQDTMQVFVATDPLALVCS